MPVKPKLELSKRIPLSNEVALSLRKEISNGTWKDYLPSERRLCEVYHISRPTLRIALNILKSEQLITVRHGKRSAINKSALTSQRTKADHLVLLITAEPVTHMSPITSQSIAEMKLHLAEQGFITDVIVAKPGSGNVLISKLQSYITQNHVLCSVLLSVDKDIQRWFSEHSIPALVFGSCHPGINLPSLDIDYRSLCRHAAGTLLSKGHRRIALVIPQSNIAGYHVSEYGFREALESHCDNPSIQGHVVKHGGTAASIGSKLDALFNSDQKPTALIVAKPAYVYIVIIYLLKRGLSVPHTVSLISRDPDHIFEDVSPSISHYQIPSDTYTKRLSRMMLQLAAHGHLTQMPNLIVPHFFEGETVRKPNDT